MNKFTKTLAIALTGATLLSFTACASTEEGGEKHENLSGSVEEIIEKINVEAYGKNYMESDNMLPIMTVGKDSLEEMYRMIYEEEPEMITQANIDAYVSETMNGKLEQLKAVKDTSVISEFAYSETMMGQPYMVLVIRFKEGQDAKELTKAMYDNTDRRVWICMEADSSAAASYGDIGMFIMMDKSFSEDNQKLSVSNYASAFETICGGKVDYIVK